MKILYFMSTMLIILCLSVFVGCADNRAEPSKASAEEVGQQIEKAVSLNGMKKRDINKLQKLYSVESETVEDFVLYTASSNVKADEIFVLKVKETEQVAGVKEKILKRIEEQTVKFKDYRPDEFFLIENHVLAIKGRFILFAVSKDADSIEQAFNDAL